MRPDRRSPLKDRPLRVPGQSLDAQLSNALMDYVMAPFFMAWLVIALAGLEWWRFFKPPGVRANVNYCTVTQVFEE